MGMSIPTFSPQQLTIVRFCARECELQMSGEPSVSWMVNAWNWALDQQGYGVPVPDQIVRLGAYVEPHKNANGFRQVGVRVGWDVKGDWRDVPRQIDNLCKEVDSLSPPDWFYEYEQIHPFVDGNGRSGVILFNWLNKTLEDPLWAPNFWDDPRRIPGYGA